MKQRLYRFFILCLSLVLLTACSAGTSSSFTDRDASSSTTESQTNQSESGSVEEKTEEDTRAEDSVQPEDIQVAGLELQSWTEYQVYLEPTETCTPAFDPIYVSIIFESATYCHLTYNGQTIELGRFLNDKYIDLFTMTDDYDETLAINGKCDTNCTDADFAIRVSSFIQGERAICLFGDEPVGIPDWSQIMETTDTEPEEPVVFRAGDQKIVQGEFYLFRIIPDESCDKTFDPFEIKIKFPKETAAWFVTDEYKNVTSVYPSLLYREDSGWMEFSSNSGSFWGMVGGGTEGADLTFYVVGLTDNLASLFKNIVALEPEPVPEPEPEPEPIQAADYDTTYYYYYGLLDDKEKVIYTQVSEALNACEKEVSLAYPISNEDFHDLFWYVLSDQPQVFWTNRSYYPSYSGGLVTNVRLDYNELADNLASEQAKVESVVQKILTSVNGMNQTQAERYIHDFLIKETIYNLGCPHNQNIYSILVNKETVCAGYARAFQYLMQRIGIPCYYCYGYIGTMDDPGWHAWNVIRINGECYNVDVTWDDWYGETDQELSYVSYEFYNVTDSYISVEHHRYSYGLLLPDCHMMSYSFENLYGHNWPTEVAMELGIPAVDDLEDYYTLFYNVLNATGIGTAETAFIVTNPATFDDIRNQIEYKGFEEGYWKRIVSEKGYNNKILYDWEWTSGRWLGSHREGVYLVQKDTVEYR